MFGHTRRRLAGATTSLTPLDVFYGWAKTIDCTWYFQEQIDPVRLKQTLQRFRRLYPAFSSKVRKQPTHPVHWTAIFLSPLHNHQLHHLDEDIPLDITTSTEDLTVQEIANHAHKTTHPTVPTVPTPSCKDIMRGKTETMHVKLVHYKHGGCSLGIAMSHCIVDGKGLHLVASELGRLFRNDALLGLETDRGVLNMPSTTEIEIDLGTRTPTERQGLGWNGIGSNLLWWLFTRLHSAHCIRPPRACITTGTAPTSHLVHRILQAFPTEFFKGTDPQHTHNPVVQLCASVDVRHILPRHLPMSSSTLNMFTGNAVYFVHATSLLSEVDGCFEKLKETISTADYVHKYQRYVAQFCQDGQSFTNVAPIEDDDGRTTQVFVNSQLSIVDDGCVRYNMFDAGPCLRILPGPSDAIQIVPSMHNKDAVEILVNIDARVRLSKKNWIEDIEDGFEK